MQDQVHIEDKGTNNTVTKQTSNIVNNKPNKITKGKHIFLQMN